MRGPALPGLLAVLAGLLATIAWGQALPRFEAHSEMVTLNVVAVDGKGRPVVDLKPGEVVVLEDGRPQPLRHFSRDEGAPARVLILIDASGSMSGDKPARARLALLRLLQGLGPSDQAALASFDKDYALQVGFTSQRRPLVEAFDGLQSFGSTALYDALGRAVADLTAASGEGRRAIVAFTDGVDNASVRTPEAALLDARLTASPAYAISVLSPLDDPTSGQYTAVHGGKLVRGREVLEAWTRSSGGATFVASDMGGIETAVTRILLEVRHQYRLGYDPPSGPPGFRRIEVRSTRKGVQMRARRGYHARS